MSALSELSASIEEVVRAASPSVAAVEHQRGHGSGVVIAQDGYIVTNSHVVRAARELHVELESGERSPAEVVGDDPPSDLAVLRVTSRGLVSLPLFSGRRLSVGQLVLAIGNPLGFERSVSLGVVSAVDRTLPGPAGRSFEGLVQTDAAINPGSSGGPLLDSTGRVVGINTAVIPSARGLGFAIPAHTVSWVVAVLLARGHLERPRLGLAAQGFELGPTLAARVGQRRALRVLNVAAGGPADGAGVRAGDLLLRAGVEELGSVDDLVRVMVLSPASELSLELWRQGKPLSVGVRPRPARAA